VLRGRVDDVDVLAVYRQELSFMQLVCCFLKKNVTAGRNNVTLSLPSIQQWVLQGHHQDYFFWPPLPEHGHKIIIAHIK